MAGLEDLRVRVEAAEEQFGLISTRSKKYSERLTALVSQMEQSHGEQHRELAALNARLGQLEGENAHLKSMLMGLLQAIENGGGDVIDHAVRDLENRIGRLVGPEAAALLNAEEAGMDDVEFADGQAEELLLEGAAADEADDAPEVIADETAEGSGPDTHGDVEDGDVEEVVMRDSEYDLEMDAHETAPPTPETVTLDDTADDQVELSVSAHSLLDRVEAAATALLTAGSDADASDEENELTAEISALLESAVMGVATDDDDSPAAGEPDEIAMGEAEEIDADMGAFVEDTGEITEAADSNEVYLSDEADGFNEMAAMAGEDGDLMVVEDAADPSPSKQDAA